MRDILSYLEKRTFLISDGEGTLNEQSLLGFLQFTTLNSYPLSCHVSHNFPPFIKPSITTFRFNHFHRSSFP